MAKQVIEAYKRSIETGWAMIYGAWNPLDTTVIYRLRYHFPFWRLETTTRLSREVIRGEGWYEEQKFFSKRKATAALVLLKLEGKEVVK